MLLTVYVLRIDALIMICGKAIVSINIPDRAKMLIYLIYIRFDTFIWFFDNNIYFKKEE